jgi:SAM-dependent methyltransferase
MTRETGRVVTRARRRLRERRGRRFLRLIDAGRHNRHVDRLFAPVPLQALEGVVPTAELALRSEEYAALLGAPGLERFRGLAAPHSKPVEYLATLEALKPRPGERLFDAAGGASGEYLLAARHLLGEEVRLFLQDALRAAPGLAGIVEPVEGRLDALALADASVDCIACHHSFEHFRGDLDRRFLAEALRVLRPGGRLAIVPLFVSEVYGEIWNRIPRGRYDRRARTVYDRSAAFAGWGPYEGFARVYDVEALRSRVLAPLEGARVLLLAVTFDGAPTPDLAHNRHQPRVNGEMKLLLVEKPSRGPGEAPASGPPVG